MDRAKTYQYGYDINKVKRQIYRPKHLKKRWGYFYKIANNENYGLIEVFVKKSKVFPLKPRKESLVYVEKGRVNNLKPQDTLLIPLGALKKPLRLEGKEDSIIYIFSGPTTGKSKTLKKSKVFNFKNQYWADILWTAVNRGYAGKKIFFKKGNNSSFHFHCQKNETYFIHSGKLLLRFRAGKGEDRFFVLKPGQAVDIPPGLMHQAGGLEDTIVIEASSRDRDSDAFLVESEFTKMPKLNNN